MQAKPWPRWVVLTIKVFAFLVVWVLIGAIFNMAAIALGIAGLFDRLYSGAALIITIVLFWYAHRTPAPPIVPPAPIMGPTGTLPSIALPPPQPFSQASPRPFHQHPIFIIGGIAAAIAIVGMGSVLGFLFLLGVINAETEERWEGVPICRLLDPKTKHVKIQNTAVEYTTTKPGDINACFREAWTKDGMMFLRSESTWTRNGTVAPVNYWRGNDGRVYSYTYFYADNELHVVLTKR